MIFEFRHRTNRKTNRKVTRFIRMAQINKILFHNDIEQHWLFSSFVTLFY